MLTVSGVNVVSLYFHDTSEHCLFQQDTLLFISRQPCKIVKLYETDLVVQLMYF